MPRAKAKPTLHEMPSTGYGDQAALERSSQALDASPFVGASQVPNLSDDTSRPGEPVTTGLAVGPGQGPEALGPSAFATDPVRMALRSMLVAFPNNDVMRLLDRMDLQGR